MRLKVIADDRHESNNEFRRLAAQRLFCGQSVELAHGGDPTLGEHNVFEECSVKANILFAEGSWRRKRENVQDDVACAGREGSRLKIPNDLKRY